MLEAVNFAHVLADETHWRIIQFVNNEALCVCELADILKMPQSAVSNHLQVIRKANLLVNERREKWIYYRAFASFRPLITSISKPLFASPASDVTLVGMRSCPVNNCRSAMKAAARSMQASFRRPQEAFAVRLTNPHRIKTSDSPRTQIRLVPFS